MLSWRYRCSALLVFLALSFAFAALSPTRAYADWVSATSDYKYISDTMPTTFKVNPVNTATTAYTNLAETDYYVPSSSAATGTVFNSAPSGSAYLIRVINLANGSLAEGMKIRFTGLGYVRIQYVTQTPTYASDYKDRQFNATNYRYFVSKSGNTGTTEIFPDENGMFTLPFTAQYVFVTCYVSFNGMSNYLYWFPSSGFGVQYERPEDQNEVAAINDQTEVLTDTTGSDTVTTDATGQYVQDVEGLQIFSFTEGLEQTLSQQLTTQETDSTVTFPGMSLAGFTVPTVTVDPMQLVSDEMATMIRTMVTFVFCSAFVSHIVHLLQAIFGIYEYGSSGMGMDSYDMGPQPVKWKSADYSIDEDLGF